MKLLMLFFLLNVPVFGSDELDPLLKNLNKVDLSSLRPEARSELKNLLLLATIVSGNEVSPPLVVEGILEHKYFKFTSHSVAGIQNECVDFTRNFDPTSSRTNPSSFNELVVTVNGFSYRKFISQSALWPAGHVCRLISIAIEEFGRGSNGYSTKLSLRGTINQLPFHFLGYKRGEILRQCANFREKHNLLKEEDELVDVSLNGAPISSFRNTKYGWSDMGSCRVIVDYIDYLH